MGNKFSCCACKRENEDFRPQAVHGKGRNVGKLVRNRLFGRKRSASVGVTISSNVETSEISSVIITDTEKSIDIVDVTTETVDVANKIEPNEEATEEFLVNNDHQRDETESRNDVITSTAKFDKVGDVKQVHDFVNDTMTFKAEVDNMVNIVQERNCTNGINKSTEVTSHDSDNDDQVDDIINNVISLIAEIDQAVNNDYQKNKRKNEGIIFTVEVDHVDKHKQGQELEKDSSDSETKYETEINNEQNNGEGNPHESSVVKQEDENVDSQKITEQVLKLEKHKKQEKAHYAPNSEMYDISERKNAKSLSLPHGSESKNAKSLSIPDGSESKSARSLSITDGREMKSAKSLSIPDGSESKNAKSLSIPHGSESKNAKSLSIPDGSESKSARSLSIPDGREIKSAKSLSIPDGSESKNAKSLSIPDGSESKSAKSLSIPDGSESKNAKSLCIPDGSECKNAKSLSIPDGSESKNAKSLSIPDGSESRNDKSLSIPDGSESRKAKSLSIPDGSESKNAKSLSIPDGNESRNGKSLSILDGSESKNAKSLSIPDGSESRNAKSLSIPDGNESRNGKSLSILDGSESKNAKSLSIPDGSALGKQNTSVNNKDVNVGSRDGSVSKHDEKVCKIAESVSKKDESNVASIPEVGKTNVNGVLSSSFKQRLESSKGTNQPENHTMKKELTLLPPVTNKSSKSIQRKPSEKPEEMQLAFLSLMKAFNMPQKVSLEDKLTKTESLPAIVAVPADEEKKESATNDTGQVLCRNAMSLSSISTVEKMEAEKTAATGPSSGSQTSTNIPLVKKVSDFSVPPRKYMSPLKPNSFKKRPKHINAVPAVAKSDIKSQEDIRWRQVESSNPQAQMPWMSRAPRFNVAIPPLGARLYKRMGSIQSMRQWRVVPQIRSIETIKLELNRFPGIRVNSLRKGRDKYCFDLPKVQTTTNDDDDDDDNDDGIDQT